MFPVFSFFGFFSIQAQGLLLALGLLASLAVAEKLAKKVHVPPDSIWNAAIYGLLGLFVGERLPLFLKSWRAYLAHPTWAVALFSVRDTRLFYLGSFVGISVCVLYLLIKRISLVRASRVLLPAAGILLAFMHAGYFAVGAEPGQPVHAYWGIVCSSRVARALYGTPLDLPLFPVAPLASTGFAMVSLLAAVLAVKNRPNAGMFLFCTGLLTVLLGQFALRWLGEPMVFGLFPWQQASGVVSTLLGAALLLRR